MSNNKSENRNVNATKNRKLLVRKLSNNLWFFCWSFLTIVLLNVVQKLFVMIRSYNEYGIYTFAGFVVFSILLLALAVNRNNDIDTYN